MNIGSLENFNLDTQVTLADSVYRLLKVKSTDLTLLPGTVLSNKDICETLGVSRSPVRDAIMRLSGDGLVDIIPQKQTKVALIDLHSISEERFLRYIIESAVLKECLGKCDENYYNRLNELVDRQEECLAAKDYYQLMVYDNAFHKIFFEISDKLRCWKSIMDSSGNYERIRQIALWLEDISGNVCVQHRKIAKYLYENEADKMLAEIDFHLNKILYEEKDIVTRYPEYFKKDHGVSRFDQILEIKEDNLLDF